MNINNNNNNKPNERNNNVLWFIPNDFWPNVNTERKETLGKKEIVCVQRLT